jgi:hypothetical protein
VSPHPGADRDAWIRAIIDTYLESTDYNGLAVHDGFDAGQTMALVGLVEDDLVEVRTTETSMNPHVRRESTTVSRDQQVELHDVKDSGACGQALLVGLVCELGDPRVALQQRRRRVQHVALALACLHQSEFRHVGMTVEDASLGVHHRGGAAEAGCRGPAQPRPAGGDTPRGRRPQLRGTAADVRCRGPRRSPRRGPQELIEEQRDAVGRTTVQQHRSSSGVGVDDPRQQDRLQDLRAPDLVDVLHLGQASHT